GWPGAEPHKRGVRTPRVAGAETAEISLQADEALLKLTRDTLASREQSLQLVRQRFEGGITSEIDLRAAESALQAARVALAQTQRRRTLDENALARLPGSAPPASRRPPTRPAHDGRAHARSPGGAPRQRRPRPDG